MDNAFLVNVTNILLTFYLSYMKFLFVALLVNYHKG